MNKKRALGAGIIVWLSSTLFGWLTCGWLFNWVYQIPPNIWKTSDELGSGNSLLWTNLIGLAVALIFVGVYANLHKALSGVGAKKGMKYGFIVWLVGAVSGLAALPFYMTIATTVIVYWIISSLIINLINGAIVGAMCRE